MKADGHFVRAARLVDVEAAGCTVVQVDGFTVALFSHQGKLFAVDNRCPHMGFPLDRGTVNDGILTCHWHHARFDLASGGTFDPWADDVRRFPVDVRDGEVWIDVAVQRNRRTHHEQRLQVGLERDLSLVLAKAVLVLLEDGGDATVPFQLGLSFGTRYRRNGWGQGLTILTALSNLLPHLGAAERPRALYHGLSAVATDTFGDPPRFRLEPLPGPQQDLPTLKRWLRQFIAVRDDEGAERCIVSALDAGADDRQMAEMLFAAITDYRYVQIGHPLDFTNKAFEALDRTGWAHAAPVLTSLARGYAVGERMEEANAWRHPIDLVAILEAVFARLPALDEAILGPDRGWSESAALIPVLHGDDPQAIADGLYAALEDGATVVQLAATVSYAAALRIARFHTSNEFSDWDTALHTFTFANAVEQGLRRAPARALLRGVFDAAMSIYLDRFLNIPAARLPTAGEGTTESPEVLLDELPALLNRQQQVNEAGALVARYLYSGGAVAPLLALLGRLLLREDRDFHTIQAVEAAFRQQERLQAAGVNLDRRVHVLVAAARYLAAHAPTVRRQGQTYEIARRLHRGDRIFEG